ncbi:minor capsid protein [Paracoccus caeni]|uniref:Minor capsid protein n=1 Tax=Paracoccus caeni TaxID=657651 RepID=A0A934VYR7_9RHOB|nr:phage minor head protein [Paracoccus caeni]MBK4214518.1 minor capsid protein [Paracoccus caeni]
MVSQNKGTVGGYRAAISIKSLFPRYTDHRADFSDQLDEVVFDNTLMLLNTLTLSDTVPWVTEADLRDVSDAKEAVLHEWDARLTAIFEEYHTHPQRLRPLRVAMEERLLRAFAGLINQLRQQELGIERYIWRSRDDVKVRDSHAEYDDQVFSWDEPPAGGHPGQAHNCRCYAEPVASPLPSDVVLAQYAPAAEIPAEALLRGLFARAVAVTGPGAVAVAAFEVAWEVSDLLREFTKIASERRLNRAAGILGVDLGTAEGLLAAIAHEVVQETVIRGLPARGRPETWVVGPRGDRLYGPDGKPIKDIDWGHDHGQGQPHTHEWIDGVRQPGRPATEEESFSGHGRDDDGLIRPEGWK